MTDGLFTLLLDFGLGEVFVKVWRHALEEDVCMALRLRQASTRLRAEIEPVRSEAEKLRWQWSAALTARQEISNDGRTLTAMGRNSGRASGRARRNSQIASS